jgi:hypothetical protein
MRRLVSAVLSACAVSGLMTAQALASDTCSISVVQDYAAPLAAMPPLPPLAAGRTTLPFGPGHVTLIYRPGQQVALPGTEQGVGFILVTAPGRERAARPDWLVSTRMVKVSEAGRTERVLQTRRARVGELAPHAPIRLGLGASGEPGFYRVEIVFRNRAGRLIGRFGGYKRVLVGNLDVRFSLERTAVHPGETIEPRLENIGAAFLSFGLGTRIEVLQGGTWAPSPFGNVPPVPANGYVNVEPGEAASCWRQTIPTGAAPGTYRASLHFSYVVRTGREPVGSGETRYAEFEIVP